MRAPKSELSMFPWKEPQGTDSLGGAPDPFFPRAHRLASAWTVVFALQSGRWRFCRVLSPATA